MPQKTDINPATGQQYAVNPATGVWDDTYWSEVMEPSLGGGSSGSANLDLSSVGSVVDFATGLSNTENIWLQKLIAEMEGRKDPIDIYNKLLTEAGIPGLQDISKTLSGEIANTEDVLDSIEAGVEGRTRESMVTEAQRQRMVTSERHPLLQQLAKLTTGLGRIRSSITEGMQGVATQTQLALQGQQMNLEPYQLMFSAVVDRNARLLSAFTADRQTQLDKIFAEWERNNTLSDQQWQLANDLASEEKSYLQQLQKAAADAGATVTGNEDVGTLLGMIGAQAQAAIDETGSGSASEQSAKKSLIEDAAKGVTLSDLNIKYGDVLSIEDIVTLYTGVDYYNKPPEEPYAQEILGTYESGSDTVKDKAYFIGQGYSEKDAAIAASLQ